MGINFFFVGVALATLTTLTIGLITNFGSCKKQGRHGNKLEITKTYVNFSISTYRNNTNKENHKKYLEYFNHTYHLFFIWVFRRFFNLLGSPPSSLLQTSWEVVLPQPFPTLKVNMKPCSCETFFPIVLILSGTVVVIDTLRSNSFRLKYTASNDLFGRTTLGSTTIPSLRNEAIHMQDSSWRLFCE